MTTSISEFYRNHPLSVRTKEILITGGAGFVGTNLAVYLSSLGHSVKAMDNLVRRGSEFNLEELNKAGVEFIHGDIRNPEDLNQIRSLDVILNCAAQPSAINYENPVFDITNNTFAALNLLELARRKNAAMIQWSTNKVYSGAECNRHEVKLVGTRYEYEKASKGFDENTSIDGKDRSIYGVSKCMADVLCQEWADAFNIPLIVNRFSCLFGPHQMGKSEQGWVSWFAIANKLRLPIKIYGYGGNQVRDYLFASDLCSLIGKQIESISKYKGEVFNVGGGPDFSTSINEAAALLESLLEPFSDISEGPKRRSDQCIYVSDITKVCSHFDWKPTTTLSQGYAKIIPWIEANTDKLVKLYAKTNP